MSLSKWLPCDFEQCHPLLWGGGILVDHSSTISSSFKKMRNFVAVSVQGEMNLVLRFAVYLNNQAHSSHFCPPSFREEKKGTMELSQSICLFVHLFVHLSFRSFRQNFVDVLTTCSATTGLIHSKSKSLELCRPVDVLRHAQLHMGSMEPCSQGGGPPVICSLCLLYFYYALFWFYLMQNNFKCTIQGHFKVLRQSYNCPCSCDATLFHKRICMPEASIKAGTINYIPQSMWGVISCPFPWYLLLAYICENR